MQVLWSRALQARSSCRCNACLYATTAIARRTTTAASKRRLRISDVFTACYSTILATAAVADAKVKDKRREEWDRLIEEVKTTSNHGNKTHSDGALDSGSNNDLEVLKAQDETIGEAQAQRTETTAAPWRAEEYITRNSLDIAIQDGTLDAWGLPPGRTPLPSLGEKHSVLDWKLRNSTAERVALRDVDLHQPGLDAEEQWVDEIFDPDLQNREPTKPLHIRKMENMVSNLTNKILQKSKVFSMKRRKTQNPRLQKYLLEKQSYPSSDSTSRVEQAIRPQKSSAPMNLKQACSSQQSFMRLNLESPLGDSTLEAEQKQALRFKGSYKRLQRPAGSSTSKLQREQDLSQMTKVVDRKIPPGGSTSKAQQELSEMAKRIIDLKVENSSVPAYKYEDVEAVDQERQQLHRSLWALSIAALEGRTDEDVSITKMCYNMLVSTAPPKATTYNWMLAQFQMMQRHDLAQIVVDSFISKSRLRPNKKTIRLLLDHYRATSDFVGFQSVVQMMRGETTGLRIRRRHVDELVDRRVEFWANNNNVMHRNGYLRQKAPRSARIFDSLIAGSLGFHKTRAAVRYTRAALREGFEVFPDTLCAVIKGVVDKLDAFAGSSLLKALISQWEDSSMVSIREYPKGLRFWVYQLLQLCGINMEFLRSTTILPFHPSPASLSRFWWCLKAGTVSDAIERSANLIVELDVAIGMSGLDLSYTRIKLRPAEIESATQRLDWALQTTRKHNQLEKRYSIKKAKADNWQLRIQVLENMMTTGSRLVLARESEFLEVQMDIKKSHLQTLMCRTLPVDQETASMYVQALTADVPRPPGDDGYHMFKYKSSGTLPNEMPHFRGDPLWFIENNLFDANLRRFTWLPMRMSSVAATGNLAAHKKLTMIRVRQIKNLLIKHAKSEEWQHLVEVGAEQETNNAVRASVQEKPQIKKKRPSDGVHVHMVPGIQKALDRYTDGQLRRLAATGAKPVIGRQTRSKSRKQELSPPSTSLAPGPTKETRSSVPALLFPTMEPPISLPRPLAAAAA